MRCWVHGMKGAGLAVAGLAVVFVLATGVEECLPCGTAAIRAAEAAGVKASPVAEVTAGREVPGAAPEFKSWPDPGPVDIRMAARLTYAWIRGLEPNQAGSLWLAVMVALVVAFDVRRPFSSRNADLILLVLPGFLLLGVVELSSFRLDEPGNRWWFQTTFLGIFLVSLGLFVRSLAGAFLQERPAWTPNLPQRVLVWLAVVLLAGNVMLALGRAPDDAGYYTNLGAKRFLETGYLPYGDPLLRGGAAATYGPLLYVAHVPIQLALSTATPNARADQGDPNRLDGEAALRPYIPPRCWPPSLPC